jgi:hypothetical protein
MVKKSDYDRGLQTYAGYIQGYWNQYNNNNNNNTYFQKMTVLGTSLIFRKILK